MARVDPDDIVALLDAGPESVDQLAAWLSADHNWSVCSALIKLRNAGRVRSLDSDDTPMSDSRWELVASSPSQTPPSLASLEMLPEKRKNRGARCSECGVRWAQELGLCRRCRRSRGDERSTRELQSIGARDYEPAPATVERPALAEKTVNVGGVEYDVVWDGSAASPSLTGGARGMGSTLSGSDFKVYR